MKNLLFKIKKQWRNFAENYNAKIAIPIRLSPAKWWWLPRTFFLDQENGKYNRLSCWLCFIVCREYFPEQTNVYWDEVGLVFISALLIWIICFS